MKGLNKNAYVFEIKLLILANLFVWVTGGYLVLRKMRYGHLIAKSDRTKVIISAEDDDKSFVINIDNGNLRGMTDFETVLPLAKRSVLRIYQSIDETHLMHACAFEPQRNDTGVYSLHISEKNGALRVSNCRTLKTH